MDWMERNADRRSDPRLIWHDGRSIIMLGINYGPDENPLAVLQHRMQGAVSVYARGDDYHDVIKPRLKKLGRWLIDNAGGEIKVFVDTAPVMEKPLAEAAGLGWQGKHTNLVSRELGSWLFLGAIFTSLDLPVDAAEQDHCGTCRACLDVCPTAAFPAPYQLDARRCISYLTIEHKGPISRALRPLIGNRIYGCRRLSRGMSVGTSSRSQDAKLSSPPAPLCKHRSSAISRGSTMPASAPCSPKVRSSALGERASAQRAYRNRQLRQRQARGRGGAAPGRFFGAGARRGYLGARAARSRPACALRADTAKRRNQSASDRRMGGRT